MNSELAAARLFLVLGSWFLVLGCERSLRDVIVLIVTIRGLKPTANMRCRDATEASRRVATDDCSRGFQPTDLDNTGLLVA